MKTTIADDEREKMNRYLDNYAMFIEQCKERDLAPIEITILYLGYAAGGK